MQIFSLTLCRLRFAHFLDVPISYLVAAWAPSQRLLPRTFIYLYQGIFVLEALSPWRHGIFGYQCCTWCRHSEIKTSGKVKELRMGRAIKTEYGHTRKILLPLSNKGRFCNNSEIETLLSKRLSVENKAKLSQLTRADLVTIAQLIH